MKLRYYLRGLGIGIAVTALFFGIYTGRVNRGMSDEEVKKRAAELGMIENTVLKPTSENTDHAVIGVPSTDEATESDEATGSDETAGYDETAESDATAGTEETQNDGNLQGDTQSDDTPEDGISTEATGSENPDTDATNTQDSTVQEPVTGDDLPTEEYVQITINRGDSSLTAARKLEEAGVIEDARDFDRYLSQNGYDKYIKTGVHEIPRTGTYEQIARILTSR